VPFYSFQGRHIEYPQTRNTVVLLLWYCTRHCRPTVVLL